MLDWDYCMFDCQSWFDFVPSCEAEWKAYNTCMAGVGPEAENWVCDTDMYWMPAAPACEELLAAALNCY